MEVGAVKQAFNNELILLKKKLNQAKIQIIHKLTRKAKTLTDKKAPENLKEKLKRKATAAVNEVLIMKKVKPKDLAKFIITHKGELNNYLNKPNVDQDKACARLLLHKSLQEKYKLIRDRFSSVPIEDLLMSREERKKLKKEANEKQKNKKKGKYTKVVNAEGEWNVEDIVLPDKLNSLNSGLCGEEDDLLEKETSNEDDRSNQDNLSDHETNRQDSPHDDEFGNNITRESDDESENSENFEHSEKSLVGKFVKINSIEPNPDTLLSPNDSTDVENIPDIKSKLISKPVKKSKDTTKHEKNKNLNNKLLSRKFKKVTLEAPANEMKVADPFFITDTGENYMSVVEPRLPDEVKEVHKQGNRKLRRAAMFGHVPKIRARNNNYAPNNTFNKQNSNYDNSNSNKYRDHSSFSKFNENNSDKKNFTDKKPLYHRNEDSKPVESKPEKLHPSWEAKKRQSGIQPFKGKKIVFDENS